VKKTPKPISMIRLRGFDNLIQIFGLPEGLWFLPPLWDGRRAPPLSGKFCAFCGARAVSAGF